MFLVLGLKIKLVPIFDFHFFLLLLIIKLSFQPIESTVFTTDLALLEQDPNLYYEVWTRNKTRACNTGDDKCLLSPTLERKNSFEEDCSHWGVWAPWSLITRSKNVCIKLFK
jgi:hypothetical protein